MFKMVIDIKKEAGEKEESRSLAAVSKKVACRAQ